MHPRHLPLHQQNVKKLKSNGCVCNTCVCMCMCLCCIVYVCVCVLYMVYVCLCMHVYLYICIVCYVCMYAMYVNKYVYTCVCCPYIHPISNILLLFHKLLFLLVPTPPNSHVLIPPYNFSVTQ